MAESVIPTYSPAERDRRWNLARTFMTRENVDALIVFGEHEDSGPAPFYLDTWFTNGRPGSTIVLSRTGEPLELVPYHLCITDHMESARRGDAVWTKPENFRIGRDGVVLSDTLIELQLAQSTIGVVGLDVAPPWHPEGLIPYSLWAKVLTRLPDATFKLVGERFSLLVMPQSEEELQVVRHAAMIGDEMCRAMVQAARPGVSESAVVAAGMTIAYERGTHVPLMHLWSGAEPAASGMPPWSYRPQAPRTLQEEIERAAAIARACYDAGLRTLRPGIRFEEVCSQMLKPVLEAGGWTRGPQIHSLNPLLALCGRPTKLEQLEGAERYPDVGTAPTLLADMELEPGMTFAFEPSCAFGRHLVTIGGTVIVGRDGPIELNPFTAQLHRVRTK
ncbi:hypothetical protein LTS10_000015 [Elasticomyces elasticus]|nr:hypothetical protein LTS10_000015 [Elasticomyces elasticus]